MMGIPGTKMQATEQRDHLQALKKFGVTKYHRKKFKYTQHIESRKITTTKDSK